MYEPNQDQTFFEELGSATYREELPEYVEPENSGLSEDSVQLLQDDMMNPMPSSEQNPPL